MNTMDFTSIQTYLDPPSWQQQQNQHEVNGSERCELLPVPAALPQQNHAPTAPPSETALKCPRCESTNTKFCYFNNYNLSQPRHFCKTCRRYWTRGGALRNVPVGGGCRRNKKTKRTTRSKSPLSNDKESVLTSAANFINSSSHEQFGHFTNPSNRPNYMTSLIQNRIQSRYGSGGLQMGVHALTSGGEGASVMDQWRFPFLNGFESTSAVSYPFQSQVVEATTSRVTQQRPLVKSEYNGGINMSRSPPSTNNPLQFMGY